jgi:hypothetical protein
MIVQILFLFVNLIHFLSLFLLPLLFVLFVLTGFDTTKAEEVRHITGTIFRK